MYETMVCYHISQTRKQSMQRVKKGQPCPIKAKVHAGRTKQMLLALFDSKGLLCYVILCQRQEYCEGPGQLPETTED
jgi:hypothetical protein